VGKMVELDIEIVNKTMVCTDSEFKPAFSISQKYQSLLLSAIYF
jgi:hypothetical protein